MGVMILSINSNYVNYYLNNPSKLTNSTKSLTTRDKSLSDTPNSVNFNELAMLLLNQLNQTPDSQSSDDEFDNTNNGIKLQNGLTDTSDPSNLLNSLLSDSTSPLNSYNGLNSSTLSNFTNDGLQESLTNLIPSLDGTSDPTELGLTSFLPNTNNAIGSFLSNSSKTASASESKSLSEIINSAFNTSNSKEDFLNILKNSLSTF
jgi:hypothetical protein